MVDSFDPTLCFSCRRNSDVASSLEATASTTPGVVDANVDGSGSLDCDSEHKEEEFGGAHTCDQTRRRQHATPNLCWQQILVTLLSSTTRELDSTRSSWEAKKR